MNSILLDADLKAKLGDLQKQVDVVDVDGTPVGCFLPQPTYLRLLYDLARLEVSDEELQEAREDYRKNGGFTTAEILEYLASLDSKGKPTS